MMNLRKKAILAILAGGVLLAAACSKPAEDTAAQAPPPEEKKTVEAFGRVEINEIKNISLDFSPLIEAVQVKEGQRIKRGDPLLTFDAGDYQTELVRKQHELNSARLEVRKLENMILEEQLENNSDPDVRKLMSGLDYAEAIYRTALKDQETQEALYKAGALSQHAYDEFVKTADAKRKEAEDIRYSLDVLLHDKKLGNKELNDSIVIGQEKAAAIESEIKALKEKLKRSYIEKNVIVADVDNGIVSEIGCKAGDVVASGTKILSLMNLDTMVVKANVAEEFIKDVKPGARVDIIPLADKGKQYAGKVASLAGQAIVENGETVVPVEISIENKDAFLLPNFNVDVKIYME